MVFHLIVVTSIDNVLRPFLVPKSAHLSPALMLLSVFAGLGMFGFWGIVLGPVLMIIIVTTISVYLAVYKGAPLDDHDEDDDAETQVALAMAARQTVGGHPGARPAGARCGYAANRSLRNSTTRLRAS